MERNGLSTKYSSIEGLHKNLTVERISERDFLSMRVLWDNLLKKTSADPLFMSWPWLSAWWEVWGKKLFLESMILGFFDRGELVGLFPMYFYRKSNSILPLRRLQIIGNAWRICPTVRSEYTDLIVLESYRYSVMNCLVRFISKYHWDDLIICDYSNIVNEKYDFDFAKDVGVKVINRSIDHGIRIPTSGNMDAWLNELGKNTRLKAFNRRNYMDENYDYNLVEVNTKSMASTFSKLNEFHIHRWGKPCFGASALDFHKIFLERLSANQELKCSKMIIDGKVCSILYDIRAGSCVYNLQSGFIEDFSKKLSLGTIHLGFSIEKAFSDSKISYYDLLAGKGKNTFYKNHFKGKDVGFYTVQIVRSQLLKFALKVYERSPKKIIRPILGNAGI